MKQKTLRNKKLSPVPSAWPCIICGGDRHYVFSKKVLGKYDVKYLQCRQCGFLGTESPYWLKEAYSDAISSLDVGLVSRNIRLATITSTFIDKFMPGAKLFLDYAGGYGLFTRLMRDGGYHFYRQDQYCQNIFAENFDLNDLRGSEQRFDLVTAFEVFEHLPDPRQEVTKIFQYAESIFFSTDILPESPTETANWWYLSPEAGQHISFYSVYSLKALAQSSEARFFTNGRDLHLLTRRKDAVNPFPYLERIFGDTNWRNIFHKIRNKLAFKRSSRPSLTESDHRKALIALQNNQSGIVK